VEKTPMRIMILGEFCIGKYGWALARFLEVHGYSIVRIAMDWTKQQLDPKIIFNLYKKAPKYRSNKIYYPLQKLLDQYPVDIVFLAQNPCFLFTLKRVKTPIIYYHQDLVCPRMPKDGKNLIKYFLFAYYGAIEQMKWIAPIEMRKVTQSIFMPYAVDPTVFKESKAERNIFLGFMGTIDWRPSKDPFLLWHDPVAKEIYGTRVRFIEYAQQHCGLVYKPRPKDSKDEFKKWIQFMHKVVLAINIPGQWGWVNERQFTAPLCGCVLLQWRYPQLTQQGFIDYENCLMFSTEKELSEKIEWAKHHPKKLKQIQLRGKEVVLKWHTLDHRFKSVLYCIKNINGNVYENDRNLWKKWRKEEYPKDNHLKFETWRKLQC
jgi:hypothetical protein